MRKAEDILNYMAEIKETCDNYLKLCCYKSGVVCIDCLRNSIHRFLNSTVWINLYDQCFTQKRWGQRK